MTQDVKQAGQIVAFRFPQTDLEKGKLRPALLLAKLPGEYDDWLTCMISSRTRHYVAGFDEIVQEGEDDFEQSGLKVASIIRIGRLAVMSGEVLLGAMGQVSDERLARVKQHLSDWLSKK
ncbi:MAG: type II toxin-antitoxin system PemK/MazF family toxin [Chloroflexota bacterium]